MNDNRLFQRVILQSGVTKQKTIFYNDEASEVRVQKDIFQKLTSAWFLEKLSFTASVLPYIFPVQN